MQTVGGVPVPCPYNEKIFHRIRSMRDLFAQRIRDGDDVLRLRIMKLVRVCIHWVPFFIFDQNKLCV